MAAGTPLSPRLVKGGIVILDPNTSALQSVIALQYNPDSLSRTLQIQAVQGGQDGTRVDALRLRGPAVETIKTWERGCRVGSGGSDGSGESDPSPAARVPAQNPRPIPSPPEPDR